MNDQLLRSKIHQAVDAYGAPMRCDPHLSQRIIARTQRKEGPRMKKLSAGAVIAIVLMLLSLTALAVTLTVEEMWAQSFEKMNTTGEIHNFGEPAEGELSAEEAIAIARKAIQDKFGTPDEELDSMGLYPTYYPAEVDDGTAYPSEWRIYFSSRTDVDLDYDYIDYGPLGEYRVYMDATTREIDTCIYYTNDFWQNAQRVWDCGNYDEVYWHYQKPQFYSQSTEMQAYWTQQLAGKGYEVRTEDEKLHDLLLAADIDLQFCELSEIAAMTDQVDVAWGVLEKERGLNAELLQKYGYVATIPDWNTGHDNVCIHFSYEQEWDMMAKGFLDEHSEFLFYSAKSLGLYMVSFEPGTINVAAITHVLHSETQREEPVTEGGLLARTDWTPADLVAFDAAYEKLDLAVKRMRAANLKDEDITVVVRDYMRSLGADPEYYPAAPAEADVQQWFAETTEYDAKITAPSMSYEDFSIKYGSDSRFWPLEVMIALYPNEYRMPREDSAELSIEEAIDLALKQVVAEKGQAALDELGDYVIGCHRVNLTNDPEKPDCRWEIYITNDPKNPQHGWRVTFGEWENRMSEPYVQHITDRSNG